MAVAASNLALRHFALEAQEAASPTREFDHIPALGSDVIELQDDQPRIAAIYAPRSREHLAYVRHIAAFAGSQAIGVINEGRLDAPRPSTGRGSDAMAVDANDFTAGELASQTTGRCPLVDENPDFPPFLLDMVELKHRWISLAASGTVVGTQIVEDERTGLLSAAPTCGFALVAMQGTPGLKIGSEAFTAPPLVSLGMPVIAGKR